MPVVIVPYTPEHVEAVREFNGRLRVAGIAMRFPESEIPAWLPKCDNRSIYQEHFLALDGQTVRGGYILKHQNFTVSGQTVSVGNYQLPISEGVIDKRYGLVGLILLNDALKRNPLLYSLGIGGHEESLARLLKGMGWKLFTVPFFFRICHPVTFLRNIRHLRNSWWRRLTFDLLAFSGAGWITLSAWRLLTMKRTVRAVQCRVTRIERFDEWADSLWQRALSDFKFAAVRGSEVLNTLYAATDIQFVKLKVTVAEAEVGWAVVLVTQMADNKFFGSMIVATVVDNVACAGYENEVMLAATDIAVDQRADLIVTNQSHENWGRACDSAGFLRGPSNFIFAASPQLAAKLAPPEGMLNGVHLTRGDGDGPIHL
jgi:hypothetical protein